jgi:oligosaccharyltransferase complex subunit gamma
MAFLMLTVVTPYQTSPSRQRAQIYLWTAVIFVMFSILISFFRVKNRGYPFKLLF